MPSSTKSLLMTVLLLSLLPSSMPTSFPGCLPSTCSDAGFEISYPFWIATDPANPPSSYCGYTELMLHCHNSTPTLNLPGADGYTVTSIYINSQTLSLVDTAALAEAGTAGCPRPRHNVSLSTNSILSYTSKDTALFFYYNCSKTSMGFPLACSGDGGRYSYVLTSDMLPAGDCEETVVAPAMHDSLVSFFSGDVAGVVEKGFQLHWDAEGGEECRSCEGSGGRCGQNEKGFLCFCSDGINGRNCSGGIKTGCMKFDWLESQVG